MAEVYPSSDKVTKLFKCDCSSGGLTVSISESTELRGYEGDPYLDISFWSCDAKYGGDSKLSMWRRIKYAWRILRGGTLWADMVILRAKVAKHLAYHILYLIQKSRKITSERLGKVTFGSVCDLNKPVKPTPPSAEDIGEAQVKLRTP